MCESSPSFPPSRKPHEQLPALPTPEPCLTCGPGAGQACPCPAAPERGSCRTPDPSPPRPGRAGWGTASGTVSCHRAKGATSSPGSSSCCLSQTVLVIWELTRSHQAPLSLPVSSHCSTGLNNTIAAALGTCTNSKGTDPGQGAVQDPHEATVVSQAQKPSAHASSPLCLPKVLPGPGQDGVRAGREAPG